MRIIIFCINYNSYDELMEFLKSLEIASTNSSIELTVVLTDNSMKYKRIDGKYSYEFIQLITKKNLGYFGGAIYGIQNCGKKLADYDYCAISNVDLSIDKEFFNILSQINIESAIGCIAPRIYSVREERDRNPKVLNRYSSNKLRMLKLMYKFPVLDSLYTALFFKKRRMNVEKSTQKVIYAAHGSFMLFTKSFLDFLQNMKYPVFMFGEEIFIAENLRKMNLKTIYMPQLLINDMDHVSTSKMKSKFYYKCNFEAMDMLIKEYFNE